MRYLTRWNLLGLALFLAGLAAFIYGGRTPPDRVVNPPPPVVEAPARGREAVLSLYFPSSKGGKLVVERRRVVLGPGEERLERAFSELAKGPEVSGARPLLPAGAPPPVVFDAGPVVYVDLPGEYRELGYGVEAEILLLYGLANTALANSDAEEARFLLDGKPELVLGHLSLADPFRRTR